MPIQRSETNSIGFSLSTKEKDHAIFDFLIHLNPDTSFSIKHHHQSASRLNKKIISTTTFEYIGQSLATKISNACLIHTSAEIGNTCPIVLSKSHQKHPTTSNANYSTTYQQKHSKNSNTDHQ
jgi:hypothetical protein